MIHLKRLNPVNELYAKNSTGRKECLRLSLPYKNGEKRQNKRLSSERILNENVIGKIKRFKIVCDRYRNRRKRFGLRFNLIAGIYNYELKN